MEMKVRYDEKADVLYIAREGVEEATEEVAPGVNLEYDGNGQLIGVEVLRASQVLKDVLGTLYQTSKRSA